MGGVSEDELAREFTKVLRRAQLSTPASLYDLREAVTTDLERAGVSHLVMRYVTGHSTSDILNVYTSLAPSVEMKKYFVAADPLIQVLITRARQLGLRLAT
jgi:hypothetical protein